MSNNVVEHLLEKVTVYLCVFQCISIPGLDAVVVQVRMYVQVHDDALRVSGIESGFVTETPHEGLCDHVCKRGVGWARGMDIRTSHVTQPL